LQDKITSSIVATIGSKVLRAEITRAQRKPTDNLSAYDLYLRALAAITPSRTESSVNQAVELLQRAIATDQLFSSAYGLLACAHCLRLGHGWASIEEAKTHGLAAAKEAVELGNDDPIALYLGGFGIAYLGGQMEEGLAHIERALTLNPNQLSAWRFGGSVCWMMGDHEKSIRYYEQYLRLSPQDFMAFEAYSGISAPHFFLGRYDQALYWAERALRERPSERLALLVKIAALAMGGSRLEEPRNIVQQIPHFPIARITQRVVLSRSRDRDLLETALRKAGFLD